MLGALALQVGKPEASLPFLKNALETQPADAQHWVKYCEALVACGRLDAARSVLAQAEKRGLPDAAIASMQAHVGPDARSVPAKDEVATLASLFAAEKYAEAAARAQAMTARHPHYALGWKILATILKQTGQSAAALPAMRKAAALAPEDAEAHYNLGVILQELAQHGEAVASLQRALVSKPGLVEGYYNLGVSLQALGRLDDSAQAYEKALALKPRYHQAHNNLGLARHAQGRLYEAEANYRAAIKASPSYTAAHVNLGSALQDLGRVADAVASFHKALALEPGSFPARGNLLFAYNLMPDDCMPQALEEARRYGTLAAAKARRHDDWQASREPERLLRVGIVSADLRRHSVGYFLEGVFGALAQQAAGRIALFAYSNHSEVDAVGKHLQSFCAGWTDVTQLSDEQLAARIHADRIDILLDLSGHTGGSRLPMFAWKPAPIQASWLGYVATTGVAAMDYVIADPWTVPPEGEAQFTERICRLPETMVCFTPPAFDLSVRALPAQANGYITFGCFNNLTKINDATVALWARVLGAVPDSRLFINTRQLQDRRTRDALAQRFAKLGIEPDRLILEGLPTRESSLDAYNRVDIGLDPFPYPGGTTTVEALWMGVPVLTLAGRRLASRLGVSYLQNAGLPQWIARDQEEYLELAIRHAADLPALVALRAGLRARVLACPIYDAARFARHFEQALRGMWQRWLSEGEGAGKP